MNSSEATSGNKATEEVWHVQLTSGELRVMTLDQLDDAFQNGLVSENTFVYQAGMNDWIKLADLAGLDGDGDETPSEGSAVDSVAMSDDDGAAHAVAPAPPPVAPPPISAVSAAPPMLATASMNSPVVAGPSFPPVPVAGPAPVIEHVGAPPAAVSYGPFAPPITIPANPLFAPTVGPNSTAPVAADKPDLEFDSDLDFPRRKSSRGKWVLAAAALGAVAVGGVGMTQGWFARPSAAAAIELPPLPAAAAAPIAENTPPPAAEAPAPPKAADTTRISDDTRRALLDADKTRADKARARQRVVRTAAPRGRPAKSNTPFHKGGNPHDPLNSSL